VRFATTRLRTGPRLHYAEQGDPPGEPLLFLHGWPDSWFSFSRVAPELPSSWRLLLLDQRGFGESDRPEHGYSIDDLAADAAAFLDAVSVERATVIGHSFGSFVARRMALAYPDRVARLILIGTGWLASNPVTREVQTSLTDLDDPIPEGFARDFQTGTAHAPLPADFFDRIIAESLKLPARLWREALKGLLEYDDVQGLDRIEAPVLLLWGEHDALFPRDDQDRLAAAIPDASLVIYRQIGHCPNWECPEQVAADIRGFVARHRQQLPVVR